MIIFPETSSVNALVPLKKIVADIRKQKFKSENNKKFGITVSIGVSEFYEEDGTVNEIIHRADAALYFAKNNGKDRVVVYESMHN